MARIEAEARVPDELAGHRLDQACSIVFPDFSRSRLKAWILAGSLTVDGRSARPRDTVAGGECLALRAEAERQTDAAAQAVDFGLVAETDTFLVIAKPAGLIVHPGAGNPDRTLQNGLLHRFPELAALPRAGILHRLDKDTSGLLVVARTLPALADLGGQLQARTMTREYLAVCNGVLTGGGTVDAPIGRHPVHRTRMAVVARGGRRAITHYRVVERFDAHTLLRVNLETGRTHQIRVHLAHRRHPLVGDPVYGGRVRLPAKPSPEVEQVLRAFRRQALHATLLRFTDPSSGAERRYELAPPADLETLIETLREHAHG